MAAVSEPSRVRRRVVVRGVVQGVGFRPHVYSLARRLDLAGAVWNDSRGVVVEVEGRPLDVAAFTHAALEAGVRYLGLCCGAAPHHVRAMAEAMGRRPPASRFSADMSKHAYLGTDASLRADNLSFARSL